MSTKKVRMLVDQPIDGLQYRVNQVVEIDAKVADRMVENKTADDTREAVDYCIKQLKQPVLVHQTEAERAAVTDVTKAQAALDAAKIALEGEKDAAKRGVLQKAVEDAQAALTAAKAKAKAGA